MEEGVTGRGCLAVPGFLDFEQLQKSLSRRKEILLKSMNFGDFELMTSSEVFFEYSPEKWFSGCLAGSWISGFRSATKIGVSQERNPFKRYAFW